MEDEPQEGARRRAGPDREAVRQGLGHAPRRAPGQQRHRSRLHRFARPRHRARRRRPAARPRRSRSTGRSPRARPRSTLAVIAEVQKRGGTAAFVDAEHALDPAYAEKLGVNVDELLVSQPDTGEQALEITDMLVRSGAVDIVVIDSVAALTPKAEIEGEMGEMQMGLQARLMSQALRKLTGNIKRSNTIVIFINQIRMKIGVMFGNPETTTGGNALKFYASRAPRHPPHRRASRTARKSSATRPASRSSRTRSRRRSARPSSRSCTATASRAKARSSSWARCTASSRSPAPGTATRASASARARTTRAPTCSSTRRSPRRSRRRSRPAPASRDDRCAVAE